MKTHYKYFLPIQDGPITISLPTPIFPETFRVKAQTGDRLTLWCAVSSEGPMREFDFYIYGTGHPVPSHDLHFIDSVASGVYIWHVYVRL